MGVFYIVFVKYSGIFVLFVVVGVLVCLILLDDFGVMVVVIVIIVFFNLFIDVGLLFVII